MNNSLEKLLKFINTNGPEIHLPADGRKEVILFLYSFWMEEFEKVIEDYQDEPFGFQYMNGHFTCILNDFIEDFCEISVEDFVSIYQEQK